MLESERQAVYRERKRKKERKTEEVGGVLWTTETYTKVPASSGLIDKRQLR